jgi:(p)ppGpp synthase/HD superfamily hydrolase
MARNMKLTEKFDRAVIFARANHGEGDRKGPVAPPDFAHLMIVSSLVMEMGGSEDEAIAGLLHDVVEDTDATIEEVTEGFGEDVARIVAAASEPKYDAKGGKIPWRDRKEIYLGSIPGKRGDELRVTLADKIANLTIMMTAEKDAASRGAEARDEYWRIFNAERPEQEWYFGTLASEFEALRDRFDPDALPMLNSFQELVKLFISGVAAPLSDSGGQARP